MGPAWSRTVVVVLSEFGRTFRENGTRGTDHGHGSVHWVLGGAVQGGRSWASRWRSAQTLNQNRDFPVLTEYRGCSAVSNGCIARQLADRAGVPKTMPLELGLV